MPFRMPNHLLARRIVVQVLTSGMTKGQCSAPGLGYFVRLSKFDSTEVIVVRFERFSRKLASDNFCMFLRRCDDQCPRLFRDAVQGRKRAQGFNFCVHMFPLLVGRNLSDAQL